jgi:phosphate transport system substrate-binding protein
MFNVRTLLAAAIAMAALAWSQDRNALDVQKARNEHVQQRRDLAYHHHFDLSDLPHYKPEQRVSGVIRMVGSNYVADGHIGEYWEKGFRKYHPDITFQYNLKTPSAALHALYLGVSDIGPCRKMTFEDLLAYERMTNTDPVEIVYATGSFDVPGWSPAFGIFVNKANPITRLTMKQLDRIFGAERTGAWEGTTWLPERARGASENIRTWGQLGLTGDWKDKPIHVYGVNLRYHQATKFEDQVLGGSGKWNPELREYANYAKLDGTLSIGANQMIVDLGDDPYGIAYSEITFLNDKTKVLSLAYDEGGPYVDMNIDTVRNRTYPLYDQVYMYANRLPGKSMDPKVKEYFRYILSQEGQAEVVHDGKYLPLTLSALRAQLKKLD